MLHCFATTAVRNKPMANGNIFVTSLPEPWSHARMTAPIMIGSWSQKRVKRPNPMRKSLLRSSLMTCCVCLSSLAILVQILISCFMDTVCSLVFPLTRWTKGKWEQQHPLIREKCFVANVVEIQVVSHANDSIDPKGESSSQAIIQTYGTYGNLLKPGRLYRISPRLVDFNLSRTLLNLVTLDFMNDITEVPFISLITDPQEFAISPTFGGRKALDAEATINQRFNELTTLGVSHATALTFKSSQRKAARRMIGSRLR